MPTYNLALLGFGNVGKALARLLQRKSDELRDRYNIEWRITGIASRRLGWLADPAGFDLKPFLLGDFKDAVKADSIQAWLTAARADVLFENTSLTPENGQPAIDYIRAGFAHGAHVITANKGPIVHAYRELSDLAARHGKRFMHEATVMGGAPVFSLFQEALPATKLKAFRGILNSTTNVILTQMETGMSFDEGVRKAQEMGIAETDPSADVDGWDAAVKVAALVTVLMGDSLTPQQVEREGIRQLSGATVRAARAQGAPYKLVCRAEREADGRVSASVRPEQVLLEDPLANTRGSDSIITFEMDTLHKLTLSEGLADADTTAYGLLADLIRAVRK